MSDYNAEGHPRPQLRRAWRDLGGDWRFAFDDDDCGLRERWFEHPERLDGRIIVPFPPECRASGVADTGYHRLFWYARRLDVAVPATADGRVIVHFGAVDYRAKV